MSFWGHQPKKAEGTPIPPPNRNGKKPLKPHIGDNSMMGGSRDRLLIATTIVQGILHQLEGDNFKLVIEVADGTFVVNKYPME